MANLADEHAGGDAAGPDHETATTATTMHHSGPANAATNRVRKFG